MELQMHTDLTTAKLPDLDFNFDELQAELSESLVRYQTLVVTPETIKEAKSDRAKLNSLAKALDSSRKSVKSRYMEPYTEFERKIKQLTGMVKDASASIDSQLKAYDDQRREEKRHQIESAYNDSVPAEMIDIIPLERIFDQRWLNSTTTMKKIQQDLEARYQRVSSDLTALDMVDPEYEAACRAKYIETLDIGAALRHQDQLRAAAEVFKQREQYRIAPQAERPTHDNLTQTEQHAQPAQTAHPRETLYTLRLKLTITEKQARKLKSFLMENHIWHEQIKGGN